MPADVDPVAVRQQLERVLASETFASATRHCRVLRYLVERTLAGESDQLKEYVLGTEVFDRDGAYDPRIDSIVRVEVRRLRARLEDYYGGPGAGDPLIIQIPRGAYVPVFATRPLAPGAVVDADPGRNSVQPPDSMPDGGTDADRISELPQPVAAASIPAPAEPTRHPAAGFAMIAAVASVSIALMVGTLLFDSDQSPAVASSKASVAVLPFSNYSTESEGAVIAARVTDMVTTELARLGTLSVASRTSASQYAGKDHTVPAIAQALRVDFVMESSAWWNGEHVRISARVVDAATDRKIWVGEYDVAFDELERGARQIAAEAAASVLNHRGPKR